MTDRFSRVEGQADESVGRAHQRRAHAPDEVRGDPEWAGIEDRGAGRHPEFAAADLWEPAAPGTVRREERAVWDPDGGPAPAAGSTGEGNAGLGEMETPPEPGNDHHWSEEYADWLSRPESHSLVRPYAWTGGRTKANHHLAIEALVHTESHGTHPSWELRAITELCVTPRSVAEVAALMSVPLGVARVLIADLADAGVVRVHKVAGGAPDLTMMNRVLAGLRKL